MLIVDETTKFYRWTETKYHSNLLIFLNDTIISQAYKHYGEYNDSEIQLLRSVLQPGFVVYDVGAYIGGHSIGLSDLAKKIYAFEPNTIAYKTLEYNTFLYKNIEISDYFISNDIGVSQIEPIVLDEKTDYGNSKFTHDGQLCDMVYIDYLVRTEKILPPNLVKICTNNHEYEVINGMTETITNHLPIIFYQHSNNMDKIYELLDNKGYKLFWFPCRTFTPNNAKKNDNNLFGEYGKINVLALPFYLDVKTNLPEIISNDDTWEKAIERIKNAKPN